jgi:hypothetical protein
LFVGCMMQALQLHLDINENLVRRTGERTALNGTMSFFLGRGALRRLR